jgi:NhaP-type Na+/H+ or K+/H+ antiporter
MDLGFGEAVLIFGGLLTVVAALSGVMRGTVLSASVLSVALGILLAATGVVDVEPRSESIVELVELALILTLYSDGMYVERELLSRHWRPDARALTIAMPITMGLLGLVA